MIILLSASAGLFHIVMDFVRLSEAVKKSRCESVKEDRLTLPLSTPRQATDGVMSLALCPQVVQACSTWSKSLMRVAAFPASLSARKSPRFLSMQNDHRNNWQMSH